MARSRCLKVPKGRAQAARTALAALGLLRNDLRPGRDQYSVFLPIRNGNYEGEGCVCEHDFEENPVKPASYRDIIRVPAAVRNALPRAYDVIGKVIVIKIPDGLLDRRHEIGRALLEARPEARSVARDSGVSGEDRVRRLEVIAGEPDLETVHMEHGLRFELDPSRVFFSPRLATERARVAALVGRDETVLDMFAGVGPFSIHIARRARPSVVVAADNNPAAVEYLRRNIRLNRASNVEPLLTDARELPGKVPPVDRIVMNLPHSAFGFLPVALKLLGPGGTIHLYDIIGREGKPARMAELERAVEAAGRKLGRKDLRLVRGYSAASSNYVFDLSFD